MGPARRRPVGAHAQPVAGPADRRPDPAGGSAARPRLPHAARNARRGAPRRPHDTRVVPARAAPGAAHVRGVLQHGVRPERGAPDLLRRPRQRRRRPAEGGARSRRAGDRGRAALPGRLLPPGHRARRLAARALPAESADVPAHHAGARGRRRMAAARGRHARAPHLAPCLEGGRRPDDALPPRLERPGEHARRPRHHERAVRRRPPAAADPGDRARHRRLAPAATARPAAGGLPPERGPRGVRRPRARPRLHGVQRAAVRRGARRHARRQRVHHAHAGGGGIRPLRARPGGTGTRRLRPQGARHPDRAAPRARSRAPRGLLRAVQHGAARHPGQHGGQRRQPPARTRQPGDLPVTLPALATRTRSRSDT